MIEHYSFARKTRSRSITVMSIFFVMLFIMPPVQAESQHDINVSSLGVETISFQGLIPKMRGNAAITLTHVPEERPNILLKFENIETPEPNTLRLGGVEIASLKTDTTMFVILTATMYYEGSTLYFTYSHGMTLTASKIEGSTISGTEEFVLNGTTFYQENGKYLANIELPSNSRATITNFDSANSITCFSIVNSSLARYFTAPPETTIQSYESKLETIYSSGEMDWSLVTSNVNIFTTLSYFGNLCNAVGLGGWWADHYYMIQDVPTYSQILRGGLCAALSCLEVAHYYGHTSENLDDIKPYCYDINPDGSKKYRNVEDGMYPVEARDYLNNLGHFETMINTPTWSEIIKQIHDESNPIIGFFNYYLGWGKPEDEDNNHAVVIIGYTDTWLGKYVFVIDTSLPFLSPYPILWNKASTDWGVGNPYYLYSRS